MILAAAQESAEVTNWPLRIALVVVVLAVIGLALWGMRRGWVNRGRRQSDIPEPAKAPPAGVVLGPAIAGLVVGTSTHGDWFDRIVVFDLGVPSAAEVSWSPDGVWFARAGARDLYLPAEAIVGVRTDTGVANSVRAKDSIVVVTWRLGARVVDTGFRADHGADHGTVLDGLMSLAPAGEAAS